MSCESIEPLWTWNRTIDVTPILDAPGRLLYMCVRTYRAEERNLPVRNHVTDDTCHQDQSFKDPGAWSETTGRLIEP